MQAAFFATPAIASQAIALACVMQGMSKIRRRR